MELGMVGLGRMGGNMAQRLLEGGHSIVAYDPGARPLRLLRHWVLVLEVLSKTWCRCSRHPERCGP